MGEEELLVPWDYLCGHMGEEGAYRTTFVAFRGSLNQLAFPLSWVIVLAGVQPNGSFVLFLLAVGKLLLVLPDACLSLPVCVLP